MAFLRNFGSERGIRRRSYDPYRLSSPQVFLLSMLVFLAIVAFIAAILDRQISSAFSTNPGLNGLILGVLAVGILLAFAQVMRLFREIRWVNSFRAGSEVAEPVLLAPMKALLVRSVAMALSTSSMRTMLDSIATRLDETRDISRYLIGLLVFLGLLGTFWGLLQTIGSIGDTIQSLDPGLRRRGGRARFAEVRPGRAARRHGHGVLVVAVRPLRLAGARLPRPAGRPRADPLLHRAGELAVLGDRPFVRHHRRRSAPRPAPPTRSSALSERLRSLQETGGSNQRVATAMANLADGISGLVKNMRTEQQIMRDWVEAQSEEQKAMRGTLDKIADALKKRELH